MSLPSRNGTTRRDLRTGTPVWLARTRRPIPAKDAPRHIEADVAIVGGGVSGALVADALLQAGLSVAVFDRRGLVQGSTPASTALLQFELDTPMCKLAERIGLQRAARVWWQSAESVSQLAARIADLGIRCDFRARSTAYLPGNVLDIAGLRHEAALRQRIGLRSSFIGRETLAQRTGIDRAGAIWSDGNGELDPVKLVRGLWRSAIARGARAFAAVEIADIQPGRRHVTLTTDTGSTVRASHLVLATGYETSKLLRPRGYKIISTWALATRPQPRKLWPSRCLIWQAADPYLYARTTHDGRIIAGGEDEEFEDEATRDALLPAKQAAIERKLARLLPGIDPRAEFAWTGSFGESPTGMPLIGPVPGAPRCHAVMGFGGNGITFSMLAARLIRSALLGIRDPDAGLFAP